MTLTAAAYWSRLFIKSVIVLTSLFVVTRIGWTVGLSIYRQFVPEPPPRPTVLYGKLPALTLPESKHPAEDKTVTFTLELPEGGLPETPANLPIFVAPKKSAFLGALGEARRIASLLRFNAQEESLSSTIYKWRHERANSILSMNIITGAFSIDSNFLEDESLLALRPPSLEIAATAIRSFLSAAGLLPKDFTTGKTSATFLGSQDKTLTVVNSLSEAQFVRIDFFREDYDDLPVVGENQDRSNVWFIVSGSSDLARQITAGEYHYFAVDRENFSTYPIKTAKTAWEELTTERGVFINLPESENITIRRVYLAYYDSPEYQDFFQPVFVFEGDGGFIGYVPAITGDYYGK